MDVHTKAQRSYNMSRIRSINTKPELVVRRLCHAMGYRFRLHRKDLPGTPDLVFIRYKIVIFVNGCFWHKPLKDRCGNCRMPKTNKAFWKDKLSANIKRDKSNLIKLEDQGWHCISVWECDLEDPQRLLNLEAEITP